VKNRRQLATWLGVILGTVCGLLLTAAEGRALEAPGKPPEEFHQTYPLSPGGRIELKNISGAVHITGWDRNEVKVDAIKYANSQERLDDAKIRIDADRTQSRSAPNIASMIFPSTPPERTTRRVWNTRSRCLARLGWMRSA
jgi:hypothetical protein